MPESSFPTKFEEISKDKKIDTYLDRYKLKINDILVEINIVLFVDEPNPRYLVSLTNISDATKLVLEKIRQEFISKVNSKDEKESSEENKDKFQVEITKLIKKYFPQANEDTTNMLVNYIIQENLGLGKIEILLKDIFLEEVVVNNHNESVWIYHKKHGWLLTNIKLVTEAKIRHYATMIGREVGKEITTLNPLMDAHLSTGDRVNATLYPISSKGNTITIRKFSADPWTITKFIRDNTISIEAAAFIWLAIQNELSVLVAGGTGSGKTSMLNVISNFFPPNQRIISIEDTRELTLPSNLHWVPLETRLPNPEGKGEITMLDLLVNSLRMRPDRILVGEIRRQAEAQVVLEAMHTGHSVYATIHANNSEEVIMRLTNPPIDIPKPMISSLSLILAQSRNRRTGKRRTLQIAEVTQQGDARVLLQLNVADDVLEKINDSEIIIERLKLYTGLNDQEIAKDLEEKMKILQWLVKNNIENVDQIGKVMSKYYMGTLKIDQ
ncbi:MAG TPA: ATPase, T2SS/T4P/T4SS family [Alphaproteobacteria bacterium]|nr:ATPase, T2SS/T4P/T4SS family [Alphaproteobacteria bacterium]